MKGDVAETPQFYWPPWLYKRGDGWTQAAAAVAAASGLGAGQVDGWPKIALVALAFSALASGVAIVVARADHARKSGVADEREAARIDEQWKVLLEHRIGVSLLQVTKVVETQDAVARHSLAVAARSAILAAVADTVGRGNGHTRANLFKRVPSANEMVPEDFGSVGRVDASVRTFGEGDETYVATMDGAARFIQDVSAELDADEAAKLKYGTFSTMPVGSAVGTIWAVLTVDSLEPGDLDQSRDIPLMQTFASLIAVTYACES